MNSITNCFINKLVTVWLRLGYGKVTVVFPYFSMRLRWLRSIGARAYRKKVNTAWVIKNSYTRDLGNNRNYRNLIDLYHISYRNHTVTYRNHTVT